MGPIQSQGTLGNACFPNDTCNAGLICQAKACVAPGSDSGTGNDGASDGATGDGATGDGATEAGMVNDAGLPCPGASILHPGDNETRASGTNVPFVGNARDATCKPITEGGLVWKESLGGQIGTGGTFNYSFAAKGTRTVTLTATDGAANSYTATITLTIN
ncbi:hypothetical protein BH09MYX1_BH09MYX1_41740 [soil metagenome]